MRKKWDRARERALRKKEPLRGQLLSQLDSIENSLRALEEQHLTRLDRARLAKSVEVDLEGVMEIIKERDSSREEEQN